MRFWSFCSSIFPITSSAAIVPAAVAAPGVPVSFVPAGTPAVAPFRIGTTALAAPVAIFTMTRVRR